MHLYNAAIQSTPARAADRRQGRASVIETLEGRRLLSGVVFPVDAGVIDVSKTPYHAVPNDGIDDTAAIQRAINDHPNGNRIIYLPDGVYNVSDTLRWSSGTAGGSEMKRIILQGQSTDGTILRLPNNAPGYTSPASPKAVVWTGNGVAQRFRNAVRTLTVDTGSGNLGAVGIQFMANNQGGVYDVTIRSGDGRGVIGLDMAYNNEIGPCLIKNVRVDGFDYGIKNGYTVDSAVFEHIQIRNPRVVGFYNDGQSITVRDLDYSGTVRAVSNIGSNSHMVLIDSTLAYTGGTTNRPSALRNDRSMLIRNLATAGFASAVTNGSGAVSVAGPNVTEWSSMAIQSLNPSPQSTLNLPIYETPEVPWDELSQWANVNSYGANSGDGRDDSAAVQRAIDSGKTTVYFPNGSYNINSTVLVRGNVRRIIGTESNVEIPDPGRGAAFKVIDGAGLPSTVVMERISSGYKANHFVENASSRTLALRSMTNVAGNFTGPGDVFIEDVCSSPWANWYMGNANVWARQFNPEPDLTKIVNDGGRLWILHMKTERGGTLIETRNGGMTELLGGFAYTTTDPAGRPMFINHESSVSYSIRETTYKPATAPATGYVSFKNVVTETRGGVTKTLTSNQVPSATNGALLTLYVGYVNRPAAPVATLDRATGTITFSRAVTGVDRLDLALTRDGGTNLLGSGNTVSSSDGGTTWSVAGWNALTQTPGQYRLSLTAAASNIRAAADGVALAGGASATWTVTPPAPQLIGFQINNGQAQRSMVKSFVVVFDRPVMLQSDALTLLRWDGITVQSLAVSNPSGDGRTYEAGFVGPGGSLDDGTYDLSLKSTAIRDAHGQPLNGGDQTLTFHRLFGDINGDRFVDSLDSRGFRQALGSSTGQSSYVADFDYDSDGFIDSLDSRQFRLRLGMSLIY